MPLADWHDGRRSSPTHQVSGGVESLVTRPVATTHAGMSAADRARQGISDGLLRLSIGIEAVEDLIDDLDAALKE